MVDDKNLQPFIDDYVTLYKFLWFLKNILIVAFQVHCGSILSQNDENCVNVPNTYAPNSIVFCFFSFFIEHIYLSVHFFVL